MPFDDNGDSGSDGGGDDDGDVEDAFSDKDDAMITKTTMIMVMTIIMKMMMSTVIMVMMATMFMYRLMSHIANQKQDNPLCSLVKTVITNQLYHLT